MAIHYRSHRDPKSSHQQISQLVRHLEGIVARRKDLERHGDRNAAFLPLLVGGAIPLGPAKDGIDVRCHVDVGTSLHGIPELVAAHKDVRIVTKQGRDVAVQNHDPAELPGIVGHGFAIAFRIEAAS